MLNALLAWATLAVAIFAWSGATVSAEVFSWECNSLPVDGGWTFLGEFCEPTTWIADGSYFQEVDDDTCPNEPVGESEGYRRELVDFLDHPQFWVEWRVEGDGPASELFAGAPTALGLANSFGISYTFFIARDMAKLNRDNLLPIIFATFDAGVAHTHRLELFGDELYAWYIDGDLVDSGVPEGPFPSFDAFIVWAGSSWHEPALNRWDYIRYGDLQEPFSGDFDSDGDRDGRDAFYFAECIAERGNGPGAPADPGCPWADMDADGDVDFADFGQFQRAFTGSDE